jgi:hypothetical protein
MFGVYVSTMVVSLRKAQTPPTVWRGRTDRYSSKHGGMLLPFHPFVAQSWQCFNLLSLKPFWQHRQLPPSQRPKSIRDDRAQPHGSNGELLGIKTGPGDFWIPVA